jgi:GNAT superfamily N-acetyltransferase
MLAETRDLAFEEIEEADIVALTAVMTRAFDDDAQKHLGEERGGPEGYDDGEFFHKWLFGYQESVGFKVLEGEQIIGGIIVWVLPDGHNVLGTIFVDPERQDVGVGVRTWLFIEEKYPETKSWRLATPTHATKNHHFYTKCGFSEVESDPIIPAEEGITIYRKVMK